MDDNNFSDIGKRISSLVQDAVNTMDFDKLNQNISSTVNGALDEVQKKLKESKNDGELNRNRSYKNRQHQNRQKWDNQPRREVERRKYRPVTVNRMPPGSVSGVLSIVFGSIGAGLTILAFLIFVIRNVIIGSTLAEGASSLLFGFLPAFLLFLFMQLKGISLRRRVKRFRRYEFIINRREYCPIKELAFGSGQTEKYIIKDLKRMIRRGMFREGHIDQQKTCLMLTYDVYQQYLKLQEEMAQRKMDKISAKNQHAAAEGTAINDTAINDRDVDERIKQVIGEGREYVRQIQEANEAILGHEVSQKLTRLETAIRKIFDYIKGHPEQVSEIRQFTEYYLPTTLKLVNTYKELENQAIQRENIISAKSEIEKTLDTINLAFENLYDSLFEDVAMDVTTDISVLETMLKREGLTEKDFK